MSASRTRPRRAASSTQRARLLGNTLPLSRADVMRPLGLVLISSCALVVEQIFHAPRSRDRSVGLVAERLGDHGKQH